MEYFLEFNYDTDKFDEESAKRALLQSPTFVHAFSTTATNTETSMNRLAAMIGMMRDCHKNHKFTTETMRRYKKDLRSKMMKVGFCILFAGLCFYIGGHSAALGLDPKMPVITAALLGVCVLNEFRKMKRDSFSTIKVMSDWHALISRQKHGLDDILRTISLENNLRELKEDLMGSGKSPAAPSHSLN